MAKLAPLIAARTDRVAAILDASRGTDFAGMSDEDLMAELRELREKQGDA